MLRPNHNAEVLAQEVEQEVIQEGGLGSPQPFSEEWLDLFDIGSAMELDEEAHENEIAQD